MNGVKHTTENFADEAAAKAIEGSIYKGQNSKLTPVLPFLNRKFKCRLLSQNQFKFTARTVRHLRGALVKQRKGFFNDFMNRSWIVGIFDQMAFHLIARIYQAGDFG